MILLLPSLGAESNLVRFAALIKKRLRNKAVAAACLAILVYREGGAKNLSGWVPSSCKVVCSLQVA